MLHETMTSVVVSANLNSIPQLLCEAIDTGQYQRIYINTGAYLYATQQLAPLEERRWALGDYVAKTVNILSLHK